MKILRYTPLLLASSLYAAEDDVTIPQRNSSNRNAPVTINGQTHAGKPLGFNATTGVLEALSITGTGSVVKGTSPTFTTSILLGSAGVSLADDGDGALTILGRGDGFDEDLKFNFDDASNIVDLTSSTGVSLIRTSVIGLSAANLYSLSTAYIGTATSAKGTIILYDDGDGFNGTISPTTLTDDRVWTMPDLAGTVALRDAAQTFTGLQTFGGSVTVGNGSTSAGVLTLLEDTDAGSNYASFQVPALAANTVYTLPADDGDAGQVLSTNGSGTLDWVTPAAGSGDVATDTIWDTAGDMVVADGANSAVKLPIGTANQILQVNAGATAPEWTSDAELGTLTASSVLPASNGGAALGNGTTAFSDLFLASGGVVNFANGDWVGTHSTGIFTVGTGDLRVTTAGTNTASVVTVGGTQTLTGKTLTSPAVTTGSYSGAQTQSEGAYTLLDSVLSADGTFTGTAIPGTAGATLAFGDLIVLDVTDSRWELADANSAAAADGDARGMIGICVLAAAADGDPTVILLQGTVRADTAFPSLTVNGTVHISETAGDVTSTSPTTEDALIRPLGTAITADSIYFNPSGTYQTYDVP